MAGLFNERGGNSPILNRPVPAPGDRKAAERVKAERRTASTDAVHAGFCRGAVRRVPDRLVDPSRSSKPREISFGMLRPSPVPRARQVWNPLISSALVVAIGASDFRAAPLYRAAIGMFGGRASRRCATLLEVPIQHGSRTRSKRFRRCRCCRHDRWGARGRSLANLARE